MINSGKKDCSINGSSCNPILKFFNADASLVLWNSNPLGSLP